jgi:hypothetical protein
MTVHDWLVVVAVMIAAFFIGAVSVALFGWWGMPLGLMLSLLFGRACSSLTGRR